MIIKRIQENLRVQKIISRSNKMKKKKQEKEIIECMNLEEAEKIVSDKRSAGINPRTISQTTFLINGQEKRFNIPQIPKIEKNKEQNQNEELKSETRVRDSDKSLTFELFKQGKNQKKW
ncbi:MAG: hypothetical protein J4F36_03755 [Nitrosopumilaceae archaeon]|nr:hypothetical protein [Nitrosopumilaceae archaeon]